MNTTSNKNSKVPSTATNTLFLLAAFGAGVLLALIVGMLGAWPIVMTVLAGVGIFALMIFIRTSIVKARSFSSLSGTPPFTDMATSNSLYSLTMIPSQQEGWREEQEEFVPFVFNDK